MTSLKPNQFIKIITIVLISILLIGCDDETSTTTETIEDINFEYIDGGFTKSDKHLIYINTDKNSYVYNDDDLFKYTVSFVKTDEPISTIEIIKEKTKSSSDDDNRWTDKEIILHINHNDIKDISKEYINEFKKNITWTE